MSIIKVVAQTHPFNSDRIELSSEPQELCKIYESLKTGLDISHARILINDEIITDFNIIPPDGSTVYIKIVPAGGGGNKAQGKKTGWLGALAVGIGAVMVMTGFLAPLGTLLIGSGASMIASGIVLYNIDIPDPGDGGSSKQDPSIRGSRNKENQWGSIPVILGRHLLYPDVAAKPFTSISGNQQYLHQLFCAGYNDIDIELDSIKIGDTKLTELSATKNINNILAGTDGVVSLEIIKDGSSSTIYPTVCRELTINKEVKKYLSDGTSGAIINTTPDKTTKISVDLIFPNGLFRYNYENKVRPEGVEYVAEYKLTTEPDSSYAVLNHWALNEEIQSTLRYQANITVPSGQYDVRVTRISTDSSENHIDEAFWSTLKSYTDDRPVRPEVQEKLCIIALKVRATDRLNGVIDQFNFIAQTNIKRYTGSGSGPSLWTKALTSNPASMFLYTLQGQCNSDPVADSSIDWTALEEWYDWCDENDYTCNAVVSKSITISQLLNQIALTARAEFNKRNSLYTIIQDKARPSPVQLFSPRNTWDFSSTKTFADIPHALEMQYVSETAGWADDQRVVYNETDGYGDGMGETIPAVKKQKANLWGVTNADQAYKIGRYMYACTHLRPEVYNFNVDLEYLLCSKGDRALLAHDVPLMGLYWGRIKNRILDPEDENFVTGFILDEIINMETGNSYSIKIRMSTGQIITRDVVFAGGESDQVMLQLSFDISFSPDAGDHFAFGITGQETVDVIITGIEPMENLTAKITAVDYSPAIFDVDNPGFVIPPYDPKITVGGTVDDGLTKITPVEQDLYNLVSQRPTYAEIVSGFTGGGSDIIPLAPVLTARSFIRSIALMWSQQSDITNLLKYELQVTDDTESGEWFALRTDGVDWKGELDGFTEIAAGEHWYFHANIPPAGTEEEPASRQLYYRVRAITRKEDISEWSDVATAQTGLVDSPDISAGSITAGKLVAGLINALFAQFGNIEVLDDGQAFNIDEYHRLLISPYTIRWQTRPDDISPWETRRMIGNEAADEILADIVRFRGLFPMDRDFDFSIGYVRLAGSLVYDFDGNLMDQNGENGLTEDEDINYSAGKFWFSEGGAVIAGSEVEYAGKLSKTFSRNVEDSWTFGAWIRSENVPEQIGLPLWESNYPEFVNKIIIDSTHVSGQDWSPDGSLYIFRNNPPRLYSFNSITKQFTEIENFLDIALPGVSNILKFSPSGDYLAIATEPYEAPHLCIYKKVSEGYYEKCSVLPSTNYQMEYGIHGIDWYTDDYIAITHLYGGNGAVRVYKRTDSTTFEIVFNSSSSGNTYRGVSWSPDGSLLVVAGWNTGYRLIAFSRSGDTFTPISGIPQYGDGPFKAVKFTPDGNFVACTVDGGAGTKFFIIYSVSGSTFTLDYYEDQPATTHYLEVVDNYILFTRVNALVSLKYTGSSWAETIIGITDPSSKSGIVMHPSKRFLSILGYSSGIAGNSYLIESNITDWWIFPDVLENIPKLAQIGDPTGDRVGLYYTASGLRLAKENSDNVTDAIALPAGQWNFVSIRNNADGTLTLRVGAVTKTLSASISGAVNLKATFMLLLENLMRLDDLLFAPFIVPDATLIEYYTSGLKWADAAAGDTFIGCSPGKKIRMIDEVVFEKGSSEANRPPIGIPTIWFSAVPDWALAFDDGSGPYNWEDYPEFDNEDFKAMLIIWANAGWMPAYNSISFYVPDLKGLFPRISGTNAIRSSVYAGGNLAAYLAHQFEQHQHNHTHGLGYSTDDNAHSPFNMAQGSNDRSYTYYVDYSAPNASSGNYGAESRPGSFSLRIIVRFE